MDEKENKKEYEMSYHLVPDIPEDKIDSETIELKNIITENGGDIVQADLPKKRRLAYPIRKQNQAYFGVVHFDADKDGLDKTKKALALCKKILRFLILTHSIRSTIVQGSGLMLNKVEALSKIIKPKPSPIIAQQPAKTPAPAPTQSFDQKLESILKG